MASSFYDSCASKLPFHHLSLVFQHIDAVSERNLLRQLVIVLCPGCYRSSHPATSTSLVPTQLTHHYAATHGLTLDLRDVRLAVLAD